MFSDKPLEQQEQWQVESALGFLIGDLHGVRQRAADHEKKAGECRAREAELLAEIRAHRQRLGIADEPIRRIGLDAAPTSGAAHYWPNQGGTPTPHSEGA